MRFLRDGDEKAYDKARKRLRSVRSGETLQWADTSLWAAQEGLDSYRAQADPAGLQQTRTALVGLLAAVDTLLDRQS